MEVQQFVHQRLMLLPLVFFPSYLKGKDRRNEF